MYNLLPSTYNESDSSEISNEIPHNIQNDKLHFQVENNLIYDKNLIYKNNKKKATKRRKYKNKEKIKNKKKELEKKEINPIIDISNDLDTEYTLMMTHSSKEVVLGSFSGRKTWMYNQKDALPGLYIIEVYLFFVFFIIFK